MVSAWGGTVHQPHSAQHACTLSCNACSVVPDSSSVHFSPTADPKTVRYMCMLATCLPLSLTLHANDFLSRWLVARSRRISSFNGKKNVFTHESCRIIPLLNICLSTCHDSRTPGRRDALAGGAATMVGAPQSEGSAASSVTCNVGFCRSAQRLP